LDAPKQPFDPLALTEGDDRLLPVGGLAHAAGADPAPGATGLAAHVHGVDLFDLDVLRLVLLLERLLDLGLGRARVDLEGVAAPAGRRGSCCRSRWRP